MLLFDVSPRLFNSIVHESLGNFEVLSIHHNIVARSTNVCYGGACTALIALSIRKPVLDYLNPLWLFGCYLHYSGYFYNRNRNPFACVLYSILYLG